MNKDTYKNDNYEEIYNRLYILHRELTDVEIINWWKYYQHHSSQKNDCDCIGYTVCEDILRQRGNTYLDDTYLKG